ncbi:hypothetical protein [Streptomyces sp. NPDC051546]
MSTTQGEAPPSHQATTGAGIRRARYHGLRETHSTTSTARWR